MWRENSYMTKRLLKWLAVIPEGATLEAVGVLCKKDISVNK